MARIPLVINGKRLKTLEELRENFNLAELLERFHSGQLRAWLKYWEFEAEWKQLEALSSNWMELELAEILCRIFGIEGEAKEQAIRALKEKRIQEEMDSLAEEEKRRQQEEEKRRQQEEQQRREEEQRREKERVHNAMAIGAVLGPVAATVLGVSATVAVPVAGVLAGVLAGKFAEKPKDTESDQNNQQNDAEGKG